MTIKFMQHYVTDGNIKARVSYNHSTLINGKECITLYAKDYDRTLEKIFKDSYQNETDSQSDYFDPGLVRIYRDNPLFDTALERVKINETKIKKQLKVILQPGKAD